MLIISDNILKVIANEIKHTCQKIKNNQHYLKGKGGKKTEELHKKDLHDPDNHDGVNTHIEPDNLECEVNWALGSITTNKASGGDGIPSELYSNPER